MGCREAGIPQGAGSREGGIPTYPPWCTTHHTHHGTPYHTLGIPPYHSGVIMSAPVGTLVSASRSDEALGSVRRLVRDMRRREAFRLPDV